MKRKKPFFISGSRWRILSLLCLLMSLLPLSTFAESGYVGDSFDLAQPTPPYNATRVKRVTWTGQHSDGIDSYTTSSGLHVTITSYFETPKTIRCEVEYEWKSGDRTLTSTADKTYTIYCRAVDINVSNERMKLKVGETQAINYYLSPSRNARLTFRSSDYNVASVSTSGEVTAKAVGSATITISQNMGYDAYCYVTVESSEPPTGVKVSPATATIAIGDTQQLSCSFTPSDASSDVTWSTSSSSVATVSSSGLVKAWSEGTATITATTENGLSASCEVTVYKPAATAIWLSPRTLTLPIGDTQELTYNVYPNNAAYSTTVTWSSDQKKVATVYSAGSGKGKVTAVGAGTAHITVTTDNGVSDQCVVTVPPLPASISLPSDITLSMRQKYQLTCRISPSDALTTLSWRSSDTEVATVTADGLVTAVSLGEADITATSNNGLTATCHVTVIPPSYRLVVWTMDGKKTLFDFDDEPEVTINGTKFTVASTAKTVVYEAADIKEFTLEEAGILTTGDVNGDGTVDVADIATVITVMAGASGIANPLQQAADVNGDGTVDVADIATIIDIMAQ